MAPGPQRTLHILLVSSLYPPLVVGGAELVASYLAEELAARGHRVTVLSSCAPGDEGPIERVNGVDVLRFFPRNFYWGFEPGKRALPLRALWHLRDSWNGAVARRVRRIIDDAPPDVMHSHATSGFSPAIWATAKRAQVPTVHTAHDYHLACPRTTLLTRRGAVCTAPNVGCRAFRAWHLSTTRHIDVFCSPSRFLLDYFTQRGLKAGRACVVNNGIPLPDTGLATPGHADHTVELLFVARLTPEKGTLVVLDAMRRLPPDFPVRLTVLGKGPLEEAVRAAAETDRRITFRGYLRGEEKRQAFAAADLLLVASLWHETAGLVLIEAASHGLGVIASRMGGIPEFLVDGQTGLLVAPGDADALAAAILHLAGDPALLTAIRRNAPSFARQFSVRRMTDEYLDIYRSLTPH